MKRILTLIFIGAILSLSAFSQDKSAVLQKIVPSLVVIKSDAKINFGFLISKNTIVTTIGKYKNGQVLFSNGKTTGILGYTAVDADNDVVLLKIKSDSTVPVSMATYSPIPDQKIVLLKRVYNEKPEMLQGKLKEVKDYGAFKLLLLEAGSQLQTAGMPVLDSAGNVTGMSVSPPIEDAAISFAIPSEKLMKVLKDTGALKDPDQLISLFENKNKHTVAIQVKNKTAQEILDQGILRINQKEYGSAIEKFTMLIRLNPDDADAYAFRGQAKCLQLRYKEALEDFNKAIELQPEFAEVYDMRGVCKAELGDKVGACEDWKLSYEKGYNPAFKLIEKYCDME